jgi:steroid 5-alpha reductase family enzyme
MILPLPLTGLAATLLLMTLVWLLSLALRNAGIIDGFWGLGFVGLVWLYHLGSEGAAGRRLLVAVLVSIWGLRLSAHLFWRMRGQGEDYRYADMRAGWGARFWWVSLFTVFWLQAILLWTIAMPLLQVQRGGQPAAFTLLDGVGVSVFLLGLLFEAVGDWQLSRFRADATNRGKVMDRGLWRYTRHPNYFGDAMVWWGLFLVALSAEGSWWTIYSPILMNVLLLKVSGVSLLEKKLHSRRPGYEAYARRTNAFWPWFPRASASERDA